MLNFCRIATLKSYFAVEHSNCIKSPTKTFKMTCPVLNFGHLKMEALNKALQCINVINCDSF